MKLTYAQKAEIAQKAIKVNDSVMRTIYMFIANAYTDKALHSIPIEDWELKQSIRDSTEAMYSRVMDKPKCRYSWSDGKWLVVDKAHELNLMPRKSFWNDYTAIAAGDGYLRRYAESAAAQSRHYAELVDAATIHFDS